MSSFLDKGLQCSVCMEDFTVDESVRRLYCEHCFHNDCIIPWLELVRVLACCCLCKRCTWDVWCIIIDSSIYYTVVDFNLSIVNVVFFFSTFIRFLMYYSQHYDSDIPFYHLNRLCCSHDLHSNIVTFVYGVGCWPDLWEKKNKKKCVCSLVRVLLGVSLPISC